MSSIRGSSIVAVNSSHYVVPFPSGTAVGDMAILFAGSEDAVQAPSGWTNLNNTFGGANWAGQVAYKILTSTDITTGSATVTPSSGVPGVAALLVIKSSFAGTVRETDASRNSSGSSSIQITTSSGVLGTDLSIYFGSNRAANSANTIDHGTQLQQASDGVGASGCLYAQEPAPAGATTVTFDYPTAGAGNYQVIVVVEVDSIPANPGIIVKPYVDAFPSGQSNSFVRFLLRNYAGSVPQATSSQLAIVTGTMAAGSISQGIIPNNSISPSTTWYEIQCWSSGRIVSSINAYINSDVDLSNIVPIQ